MAIRNANQLYYAGETVESIHRALDSHQSRKTEAGHSSDGTRKWIERQGELLAELAVVQGFAANGQQHSRD
jgi:hypothetical protein